MSSPDHDDHDNSTESDKSDLPRQHRKSDAKVDDGKVDYWNQVKDDRGVKGESYDFIDPGYDADDEQSEDENDEYNCDDKSGDERDYDRESRRSSSGSNILLPIHKHARLLPSKLL